MRIAIVHDYFTQLGGAEKVAEELYKIFDTADLFATIALPAKMPGRLRDVPITTSWMQHLPGMARFYRLYFPLYPLAVRSLDLLEYDLVITSSSGYVKGVRVSPDAIHVCYCHTPMRWVWSFDDYSSREDFGKSVRRLLLTVIRRLKVWDVAAARQPDHFIANSRTVAKRIEKAYGRAAEVIFPPIDIHRFVVSTTHENYYIVLARLVPYKRIDLAVEACKKLGRRLVVIGEGPAQETLKRHAGPTVEFLGRLSDDEVESQIARCRALLFPGEEDFGMAPLEVAAAGKPTIAYGAGGALETVVADVTGVFFDEQTADSLLGAIRRFEQRSWSPEVIRTHAEGFSTEVFADKMVAFLRRVGAAVD